LMKEDFQRLDEAAAPREWVAVLSSAEPVC